MKYTFFNFSTLAKPTSNTFVAEQVHGSKVQNVIRNIENCDFVVYSPTVIGKLSNKFAPGNIVGKFSLTRDQKKTSTDVKIKVQKRGNNYSKFMEYTSDNLSFGFSEFIQMLKGRFIDYKIYMNINCVNEASHSFAIVDDVIDVDDELNIVPITNTITDTPVATITDTPVATITDTNDNPKSSDIQVVEKTGGKPKKTRRRKNKKRLVKRRSFKK